MADKILAIPGRNLIKIEINETEILTYAVGEIIRKFFVGGLTYLDCSRNGIQDLPSLPDSLEYLNCSYNQMQALPNLPKSLKELRCIGNGLETMPFLPDSLEGLWCSENDLKDLPVLPETLKQLNCDNNYLEVLPKLPISLKFLFCGNNQLQIISDLPCLTECCFRNNPLLFIPPMPKRPTYYKVPQSLKSLHSQIHYPIYQEQYQIYRYLITFLILERGMMPSLFSNENLWFVGAI